MTTAIHPEVRIGHVHLTVSNIDRSLKFYRDALGFEVTQWYSKGAVFLSAGGYHHHIGLNTWYSKNAAPAPVESAGLFHVAILYPTRKDLAQIFQRIRLASHPFTGASDHGVSEALYLNDPDENGIELYWDRPKERWPKKDDGSIDMFTKPLDLESLVAELN